MAELRVTGLHVCRLPQLQVPAVAGWPNGTDDLAPPSARAAALGALGSTGWEWEERTRMHRERDPEGGGMHKGGKEGEGAWESMSDPKTGPCAAASQRPKGPGLGSRHGEGGKHSLDPRRLCARPGH